MQVVEVVNIAATWCTFQSQDPFPPSKKTQQQQQQKKKTPVKK